MDDRDYALQMYFHLEGPVEVQFLKEIFGQYLRSGTLGGVAVG
jgi:hypothetical protein